MANEIAQLIGNSPTWSNQRAVTVEDLRAMKPFLQAQGKWNPAWDAALEDSAYYSSQQEGESGMLGSPASKQLDLSSLSGYQMAETRGPGRTGVAAYLDPQGGINGARAFERGGSMHRGDWATMGSVIGGVLGGGYALSGGLGGAAGGAAAGGGGMSAGETAALMAANGMTDAEIVAALGSAGAEAAGLSGVGAGAAGWSVPMAELAQPSAEFGVQNVGAAAGDASGGALLPSGAEAGVGALDSVPAVSGTANASSGGWLDSLGSFLGGGGGNGGTNWGQLIGQLGSAALQSRATQRANQTQQAGTDAAIAEQRRQYDTTRTDQAPYREAGVNALRELVAGTNAVPSHETVMSDPGYQFAQQQGERGIRNQFAASGGRMSGAQMKAGIRFNQGNASTGYNAAYQRLQDILNRKASIAGLGQTSTQASSAAGQNATNAITGLIAGQSDANAAGQLARGNIWGNVGNNILAQYGRKTMPRTTYVDGYYEGTGG